MILAERAAFFFVESKGFFEVVFPSEAQGLLDLVMEYLGSFFQGVGDEEDFLVGELDGVVYLIYLFMVQHVLLGFVIPVLFRVVQVGC